MFTLQRVKAKNKFTWHISLLKIKKKLKQIKAIPPHTHKSKIIFT